jgi:hypothetical protein
MHMESANMCTLIVYEMDSGIYVCYQFFCHFLCPSSAEVKNEWSYTSTPCICLHGVDKENYIFITSVVCSQNLNLCVLFSGLFQRKLEIT